MKCYKPLFKTLLEFFAFEVLQNNFCFDIFNIITKKVWFLKKTLKSPFYFITLDFNFDNPKLLILFGNLSFLFFNTSFVNYINLEEL